jgi:hypothetical protein
VFDVVIHVIFGQFVRASVRLVRREVETLHGLAKHGVGGRFFKIIIVGVIIKPCHLLLELFLQFIVIYL